MADYQERGSAYDDAREGAQRVSSAATKVAKAARFAQKSAKVSGAAASLLSIKIKLAIFGGILVFLMIIGAFTLLSSAITNNLLHQNDPETLSDGYDFSVYGTEEENRETIRTRLNLFQTITQKKYDDALVAAKDDLIFEAFLNGWELHPWKYKENAPIRIGDEATVTFTAAFNAKDDNGLSDMAFQKYQETTASAEFKAGLQKALKANSNYYPYGNGIYGADFERDSSGNIIFDIVEETIVVDGVETTITTIYVTPVIDPEPTLDVITKAFSIEDIYANYVQTNVPEGVLTDATVNQTYADIISEMAFTMGNFIYMPGEDDEERSRFEESLQSYIGDMLNGGMGSGSWVDNKWVSGEEFGVANSNITAVALSQEGNRGGQKFWSWYGCKSRVAWCAIFVSWCADQCGYIDAGIIPKFSSCTAGINWFSSRGQWHPKYSGYAPKVGDLIFIDWKDKKTGLTDGRVDHVGIVTAVAGGTVYTIEGNLGNACKKNSYPTTDIQILGYATPAYPSGQTP